MQRLKQPVRLESAFGAYVVSEIIGEGGAGRVYGGIGPDNAPIAVKVLSEDRTTDDKRRRFKNEMAFLQRTKHGNIVSVIDHGIALDRSVKGPFYVMRRYQSSLRGLMHSKFPPEKVLPIFSKILDGVEAAHLLGAIHRDLKPENILFDNGTPAIADFGIASFTDDLVATTVDTLPTQRLANFMYAAPEQRIPGRAAGKPADVYALGLILNEMFTSHVPHGTDYEPIGRTHADFSYLDAVVAKMIRQSPDDRYLTIADVKNAIAVNHSESKA